MSKDIELAAKVHYGFLPINRSDDQVDISIFSQPSRIIGGDYCGISNVGNKKYILSICDAVGHSVASAMYAARVNAYVLIEGPRIKDPCEMVISLNQFLCEHLHNVGMYASLLVAYLDLQNNVLQYMGAGHPSALHYSRERNSLEHLRSQTTILGIQHPLPASSGEDSFRVGSGDKVLFYTDGITESRSEEGEEYGIDRLGLHLKKNNRLESSAYISKLVTDINCFNNGIQKDDILMMCISIK